MKVKMDHPAFLLFQFLPLESNLFAFGSHNPVTLASLIPTNKGCYMLLTSQLAML